MEGPVQGIVITGLLERHCPIYLVTYIYRDLQANFGQTANTSGFWRLIVIFEAEMGDQILALHVAQRVLQFH